MNREIKIKLMDIFMRTRVKMVIPSAWPKIRATSMLMHDKMTEKMDPRWKISGPQPATRT